MVSIHFKGHLHLVKANAKSIFFFDLYHDSHHDSGWIELNFLFSCDF